MRWWIIAVALSAGVAQAQNVTVRLSARAIADDDVLKVTFTFSGRGEGHLPAKLRDDWKIGHTQTSVSTNWVNGRVTREHSQTLQLKPKRVGTLVVGAATLIGPNGAVLARSQPMQVTVRGVKPMTPSEARQHRNLGRGKVLLAAELDRDQYYVGEPFVVTYILYVQGGERIHQPDISELELPDGVQREDVLHGELGEEDPPARLFGRRYVRVPVFREVWKVLRPTRVNVPAMRVVVTIAGRGFRSDRKTVKTPPLQFDVVPVPQAGRPEEYREGTIGTFSIESNIETDEDHGRAVLEVRISGNGSLRTLDRPVIDKITGGRIKSLPSDDQDLVASNADGVVGHRVFQYLITPERAGTVFVPAVSLTYFDPKTGRFETTSSEPQQWVARKGVASTRRSAVAVAGADAAAPELHPIENESDLQSVNPVPVRSRPWYLALIGFPLLLFVGLQTRAVALGLRARGGEKSRARNALGRARRRLKNAEPLLTSDRSAELFGTLAATILEYVEARLGLALTGMTNDQMRVALAGVGVKPETTETLVAELENCDFARFAGGAGPQCDPTASLQRAALLLNELEGAR